MARTGSTTRTTRTKAAEAPVEITETPEASLAEVSTDEATEEATPVSIETVEAEVTENPASDTTATSEVDEAAREAEDKYTEYESALATAIAARDESTGDVPVVNLEAVKTAFRELPSAKYKKRAKDLLNNKLKDAVGEHDLIGATAVMACSDAVDQAGSAKREPTERKPVDPAEAYRTRLTVAHLAYNLVNDDAPDGIDVEAERNAVQEQVGTLVNSATEYFAWTKADADTRGDEPEVDDLVKLAVKAALGKSSAARVRKASSTSASRTPREGGNRNVRTHIAQAMADDAAGTTKKISEVANAKTDEYPEGDCSPGAISAALKSTKGVDGFELSQDDKGINVIRKL
jgi:hypothetical protein